MLAKTLTLRILCGLSLALSLNVRAAPAQVDVVKIMSFSCPVCRSAEAQDVAISQKVIALGGRFVRAPVPTVEGEGVFKELVYYASRGVSGQMSENVKYALYKGAQDQGISFTDFLQIYVWLQAEIPNNEDRLQIIFKDAQATAARGSLSRAIHLATSAGVQALPAYLIMADGRVSSVVDPTTVSGGSLANVREEVLTRVTNLYK
jgi:hypothetical protein